MTSALAIRHVVDRAVRSAKSTRSVTCIIIPKDVQELDAVEKLHVARTSRIDANELGVMVQSAKTVLAGMFLGHKSDHNGG